jgi:hypothetical protein
MSPEISMTPIASNDTWVHKLGRLFPGGSPVNIPVTIVPIGSRVKVLGERSLIEMQTSEVVLFNSKVSLELNDILRLRNSDGSFKASVVIIALCYHDGGRGIAARVIREDLN